MKTFDVNLAAETWTELLNGGSFLAFDKLSSEGVQVLFTETATTPSASTGGNNVGTWNDDWDFQASGMDAGVQRIWVKGAGAIRGVR